MQPIGNDRFHGRNLDKSKNQNVIKNHQQQDTSGDSIKTINEGIAALQRVCVNVSVRDLGIHVAQNRALNGDELISWADWIKTTRSSRIANKPAFAASKIRQGCVVADVFPNLNPQHDNESRNVLEADLRQAKMAGG